ncbi:MAG TPA: RNA-binding protein [Clostridia bacterium]|nr:RNA-binding protein [Clostridia bacterium]
MNECTNELLGRVAISRAGRDSGRAFLVVGCVDADYLLLADGCLRKLAKPKKKKVKHLKLEPKEAEGIKAKILGGKQVFDAEIRNCLLNLGYNCDKTAKEG